MKDEKIGPDLHELLDIIARVLEVPRSEITEHDNLPEELGADSLSMLQVLRHIRADYPGLEVSDRAGWMKAPTARVLHSLLTVRSKERQ